MTSGSIKIAECSGVYVVKMQGDVRLTLCLSFDAYIESLLNTSHYLLVVFDLTGAEAIDSTTLGLMAKFSIHSDQLGHDRPVVINDDPSIDRLLGSMGFDDIFRLVSSEGFQLPCEAEDMVVIEERNGDESLIKRKVIEAHRYLMSLNDSNHEAFDELVTRLEGHS